MLGVLVVADLAIDGCTPQYRPVQLAPRVGTVVVVVHLRDIDRVGAARASHEVF